MIDSYHGMEISCPGITSDFSAVTGPVRTLSVIALNCAVKNEIKQTNKYIQVLLFKMVAHKNHLSIGTEATELLCWG